MKRAAQLAVGVLAGSLFGTLGFANSADAMTLVNTELILSIDTSSSVNDVVPGTGKTEYQLQIEGYINAFNSAVIRDRIKSLSNGVAVGVNTWGSMLNNSAVGNFFHLTDDDSITTFINNALNPLLGGSGLGGTNIASGINDGVNALLNNDFQGYRLVIDVSGDGKQNVFAGCRPAFTETAVCTSLVTAARDNAIANGITINGLPILTDFPDLDTYYTDYVIGGDKRFLIAASDFPDFASAVEQKIEREIAPPDSESTPEPTSLLGLGFVSLIGAAAALKRKQRDI